MTLRKAIKTADPDQLIKVGTDGGGYFFAGRAGHFLKGWEKAQKAFIDKKLPALNDEIAREKDESELARLVQRRELLETPFLDREVREIAVADPAAEPEKCIRIIIDGAEQGFFWTTDEGCGFEFRGIGVGRHG